MTLLIFFAAVPIFYLLRTWAHVVRYTTGEMGNVAFSFVLSLLQISDVWQAYKALQQSLAMTNGVRERAPL